MHDTTNVSPTTTPDLTEIATIRIFHPQRSTPMQVHGFIMVSQGSISETVPKFKRRSPVACSVDQHGALLELSNRKDSSAISNVFDVVLPHQSSSSTHPLKLPSAPNSHSQQNPSRSHTANNPTLAPCSCLDSASRPPKTEGGKGREERSAEMPILHEKLTQFAR